MGFIEGLQGRHKKDEQKIRNNKCTIEEIETEHGIIFLMYDVDRNLLAQGNSLRELVINCLTYQKVECIISEQKYAVQIAQMIKDDPELSKLIETVHLK